MINFALICVNYNSFSHLIKFIKSIEISKQGTNINLAVYVVDNSTEFKGRDTFLEHIKHSDLQISIINSENVGYFPGARLAHQEILNSGIKYDFISVSNVDLTISENFFMEINLAIISKGIGVLAPKIVSEKRGGNLNPKIVDKPSKAKLERTLRIFRNVIAFWIYRWLSDIRSGSCAKASSYAPSLMYAPHGSFIIFTKEYFDCGGNLDYPMFLFGEEIFVGESCARLNLGVLHRPELIVRDVDHGSTSLRSLAFLSSEHVKSLTYILQTYF